MKNKPDKDRRKTENLQNKNNGSITAGSGNLQEIVCLLRWEQSVLKFGRTAWQWKDKARDLQAYWVVLTENGSSHIFEDF